MGSLRRRTLADGVLPEGWLAAINRLEHQITTVAPFVHGQLVTFDFFYYMNPYVYLHKTAGERVYRERERALYDSYVRESVP